jgi:hypothetical protein
MTSKEKAVELVDKMYYSRRCDDTENFIPQRSFDHAKQCALIALQEMIKLLDELPMSQDVIEQFAYLQEVKQEIQKL